MRVAWTGERRRQAKKRVSWYPDLIGLRRSDPVFLALGTPAVTVDSSAPTPQIALVRYRAGVDIRLLVLNLGPLKTFSMNDPLIAPAKNHKWELVFCSERSKYGGNGVYPSFDDGCWRLQPHCAWLLRSAPKDQ